MAFRNYFILQIDSEKSKSESECSAQMSEIEFKELSLCKVQHRNQFKVAKLIWIGSSVVYTWVSCE